MSLRSRARKLMRETGLSYQQCLIRVRESVGARSSSRKIEVVELQPRTRADLACQQLLHTTGARTVALVDGWKILSSAGTRGGGVLFHPMTVMRRDGLPRAPKTLSLMDGLHARLVPIKRLHLIVVYDESVSSMLLDKRIEKCVEYLESLMKDEPLLAPPDSESGGSGPSGLGAVAWEWDPKKD